MIGFVFGEAKPIPDCAASVCKNGLSCCKVPDVEFNSYKRIHNNSGKHYSKKRIELGSLCRVYTNFLAVRGMKCVIIIHNVQSIIFDYTVNYF